MVLIINVKYLNLAALLIKLRFHFIFSLEFIYDFADKFSLIS